MKNDKKTKINYWTIFTWMTFFILGIIFGIVIQQTIIVSSIVKIIGYTDIDIDVTFNETKFVEEFNKTVVPELKEIFKNTTEKG